MNIAMSALVGFSLLGQNILDGSLQALVVPVAQLSEHIHRFQDVARVAQRKAEPEPYQAGKPDVLVTIRDQQTVQESGYRLMETSEQRSVFTLPIPNFSDGRPHKMWLSGVAVCGLLVFLVARSHQPDDRQELPGVTVGSVAEFKEINKAFKAFLREPTLCESMFLAEERFDKWFDSW